MHLKKAPKTDLKSRNIYSLKGFRGGISSPGAYTWAFNTMARPAEPVLGSAERPIAVDGLTLNEKAMMWGNGKVLQSVKEEPAEPGKEGLSLEERATRRAYGKSPSYKRG